MSTTFFHSDEEITPFENGEYAAKIVPSFAATPQGNA